MNNISGFGLIVNVMGSNTFPVGFPVTQFADDSDPFDIPSVKIADTSMGLNGDLIVWANANPIKITMSLIPGSDDDILMGILFEANRVGRGKIGARDIISLQGIYPDGRVIALFQGAITDGMPGNSVSSSGRLKTKVYGFSFQSTAGTP